MSPEEIEAIAQRPTYCKADGEAVTLSRAERDALVGAVRRYEFLKQKLPSLLAVAAQGGINTGEAPRIFEQYSDVKKLDSALDAAMAKERT